MLKESLFRNVLWPFRRWSHHRSRWSTRDREFSPNSSKCRCSFSKLDIGISKDFFIKKPIPEIGLWGAFYIHRDDTFVRVASHIYFFYIIPILSSANLKISYLEKCHFTSLHLYVNFISLFRNLNINFFVSYHSHMGDHKK